jgi:hypothetical protein
MCKEAHDFRAQMKALFIFTRLVNCFRTRFFFITSFAFRNINSRLFLKPILYPMKKIFRFALIIATVAFLFSACSTTRRKNRCNTCPKWDDHISVQK